MAFVSLRGHTRWKSSTPLLSQKASLLQSVLTVTQARNLHRFHLRLIPKVSLQFSSWFPVLVVHIESDPLPSRTVLHIHQNTPVIFILLKYIQFFKLLNIT